MQNLLRHDQNFVRTDLDRKLYRLGVPRKFWSEGKPKFLATSFRGGKLTSQLQESWFNTLISDPQLRQRALLLFVGSHPTDDPALLVAFSFLKQALQRKQSVFLCDPTNRIKYQEKYPGLVIVTGLTEHSPNDKLDTARYACTAFRYATRIVTVAAPNPITWLTGALHLHADVAFEVKDSLT